MTHASVFSGIGGPEVAATMLGWDNLFHCEINPFGRKVLDYWYPNSKSYEDITTTDFREWRGRVDVLTGGFPCQPFSYAGRRRGAEDDRYLWPSMYRAIDEIQPTWVVAENVAGILTMVEQGEWTGGPNTDSGATNRKLGSDMGDGVTGGGLHGKDLSKADVSVNIWCYLESIRTGHQVTASCSIGDETVCGIPYADIVEQARLYILNLGGFEKFAEWGLIRHKDY